MYGDGRQTRDFVYVSDVVAANLAAAAWAMNETPPVFNVGRGEQTDLLQILQMLRQQSGVALPVQFAEARAGDIRHSCAEVTAVQTHLAFVPEVPLSTGLQKTLSWFA